MSAQSISESDSSNTSSDQPTITAAALAAISHLNNRPPPVPAYSLPRPLPQTPHFPSPSEEGPPASQPVLESRHSTSTASNTPLDPHLLDSKSSFFSCRFRPDPSSIRSDLVVFSPLDAVNRSSQSWTRLQTRARNIPNQRFANVAHVQTLACTKLSSPKVPVWVLRWSMCGKYLATGGKDGVLRVWVLNGLDTLHRMELTPVTQDFCPPFVMDQPWIELTGHTGDILDLSWNHTGCLASASTDKTVRVWKVSSKTTHPIAVLQHGDFVPSISFHPTDEWTLVTGCFDGQVRVWCVKETVVMAQTDLLPHFITAVLPIHDGKYVVVGTYKGTLAIYEMTGTGKLVNKCAIEFPCKITGIEPWPDPMGAQDLIIVSSNDSRIRVFDASNLRMLAVLEGHTNKHLQIKAHTTDLDPRWILSGSENGALYMWDIDLDDPRRRKSLGTRLHLLKNALFPPSFVTPFKHTKKPVIHPTAVSAYELVYMPAPSVPTTKKTPLTCISIAPVKTKRLLQACGVIPSTNDTVTNWMLVACADQLGFVHLVLNIPQTHSNISCMTNTPRPLGSPVEGMHICPHCGANKFRYLHVVAPSSDMSVTSIPTTTSSALSTDFENQIIVCCRCMRIVCDPGHVLGT